MKRFLTVALAAAVGLTMASAAMAVSTYVPGDAANGVVGSRHNLGGLTNHMGTTGTTGICVFCHTPHHTNGNSNNSTASGSTAGLAPLWNRNTASVTDFTAYGSTIAGNFVASGDIGSTSLACLSCHDGTITFDNLVNAPGMGGVVTPGTSNGQGWEFFDGGSSIGTNQTMLSFAGGSNEMDVNASGDMRLVIGTNLSNDHPMSVVYYGSGDSDGHDTYGHASLRAKSTVISTIDLTTGLADSATTFDGGNLTKNLWAMNGFINSTAAISDMLRGPLKNRVECSSCHDPHFANKSYNEVDATYTTDVALQEEESDGLFLRRVGGNTGSGVCRTCHAK